MNTLKKSGLPLIILAWALSYHQLLLGISSMKWDILGLDLPWYNFLEGCLENGQLPWWNPYINAGFPQGAHPGTWYLPAWLWASIGHFDNHSIQLFFALHVLLSGIGLYALLQHFGYRKLISSALAICWLGSGIFVGNAQHLGWTIGFAWVPWVFLYFSKLLQRPKLSNGIMLGLLYHLLMIGGYAGIFVIVSYILLGWFGYWLTLQWRGKTLSAAISVSLYGALALLVFLGTSGLALKLSFQLSEMIVRGGGLPYDDGPWSVIVGYFPLKALLTLWLPYSGTSNFEDWWQNDQALINGYAGILPILVLLGAILNGSWTKNSVALLGLSAFFFATAMAQVFPFRYWLYEVLPFMDLFRFPTLFRGFGILFLLLAVARPLDNMLSNGLSSIATKVGVLLITIPSIVLISYLIYSKSSEHFGLLAKGFWSFNAVANIHERMVLQTVVQLIVGLGILLLGFGASRYKKYWLIGFVVIDICASVQMNSYCTILQAPGTGKTDQILAKLDKGFPLPAHDKPMGIYHDGSIPDSLGNITVNKMTYLRLISSEGNSPYSLRWTSQAWDAGTYLETVNRYPLGSVQHDSVAAQAVPISAFEPDDIKFAPPAGPAQGFIFMQNYHQDWRCWVDGQETPIDTFATCFMQAQVPAGAKSVQFTFKPEHSTKLILLSLLTWILSLLGLIWAKYKNAA